MIIHIICDAMLQYLELLICGPLYMKPHLFSVFPCFSHQFQWGEREKMKKIQDDIDFSKSRQLTSYHPVN